MVSNKWEEWGWHSKQYHRSLGSKHKWTGPGLNLHKPGILNYKFLFYIQKKPLFGIMAGLMYYYKQIGDKYIYYW